MALTRTPQAAQKPLPQQQALSQRILQHSAQTPSLLPHSPEIQRRDLQSSCWRQQKKMKPRAGQACLGVMTGPKMLQLANLRQLQQGL